MFALSICSKTVKNGIKFHYRQLKNVAGLAQDCNGESQVFDEVGIDLFNKKFNKSGLLQQHRSMLFRNMPYTRPHSWIHQSEKYQRKMFGLYGSECGVNPRTCFGTKLDLLDQTEFDQIAYPKFNEMVGIIRFENEKKYDIMKKRDREVANKLEKLEQWKIELNEKISKKEAETLAAKHRKERLIEEVRRHFGFKVDSRDEKFKDMLELKEKEDRKKQKEAKRKAKEEKLVLKLVHKTNKVE